jgi:hypothetical protein
VCANDDCGLSFVQESHRLSQARRRPNLAILSPEYYAAAFAFAANTPL